MSIFIKTGYWATTRKTIRGAFNLDKFVDDKITASPPTTATLQQVATAGNSTALDLIVTDGAVVTTSVKQDRVETTNTVFDLGLYAGADELMWWELTGPSKFTKLVPDTLSIGATITIPNTTGVMALVSDIPSSAGEIIVANVTGTYNIDWSKIGATYVLTMTGDTTFSDINFTAGETNAIDIYLSGAFVPTFSANWEATPSSEAYSGAVTNHITSSIKNATGGSEAILYSNENLAT